MTRTADTNVRLPGALLDPAAYPHPLAAPPRLVETHISWVLVAPPFAYKVKRPVRLDFLDFSRVEERRRFCEEELRLNRRLAPELYLDVVPVTAQGAGARFGGAGPVLDWAVRMAAFDAADELTALLAAGRVEPAELAALARDLAAFQAGAERHAQGALGDPAILARAALANFGTLRRALDEAAAGPPLETLEQWTEAGLRELAPLMQQRRAAGLVRDGHGDLHAGNIVRRDGRLVPFDCIEFDAGLRCLDVVSDVAFLVMDLQSRDRPDLAQVFLNEWLAATGDYEALRLLPFHVVYLSLVRAKVDALQRREAAGERRAALHARIDRHLQLARQWAAPPRRRLVLMRGVSGSGKSWLAARLAPLLPAVWVRSDVERKRLAGLDAQARTGAAPGAGIYTPAFSDRTYARLLDCAGAALDGGQHVIVDATFLDVQRRQPFRALASRQSASFAVLRCQPPVALCRARVQSREAAGADPSEAGLAVLERQLAEDREPQDDEAALTLTIREAEPDPARVAGLLGTMPGSVR